MNEQPSTEPAERLTRLLENLCHEIARLEQIVAILTIVVSGEELTEEEADSFHIVTAWAWEDFDAECLRESLPEFYEMTRSPLPAPAIKEDPVIKDRQHCLFDEPQAEST